MTVFTTCFSNRKELAQLMAMKPTIRPESREVNGPSGQEALFRHRRPVETKGQRVLSYIAANFIWLLVAAVIVVGVIVLLTYRAIIAHASGGG